MGSKLVFLSSVIALLSPLVISNSQASFVDPRVVLQDNFEGWGTSLAWWADMVGGMDQEIVDHVVDAIFSPEKLNLNIARYVIGGTTPDNHTCGEYRDGAATESFKDGPDSPFNWNRDLRQRKILESAKATGANLFEAFSNTPPQWMTISGCSKGTALRPPLFNNFDAVNSPQFADYATEVIKYFHEQLNITFHTYSPFNEPYGLHGIGGWVGPSQSQEGCNMGRPTMVAVLNCLHEAIAAKNLSFLKVAVSDETQLNTQIQSYDFFVDAGVSDKFHQINVHGYWEQSEVSRRDLLSSRCAKRGHSLWMDEMGWGGTPPENMEQGLNIANRIVMDLRTMIPSAWVYWQAIESGGGWGLISVPYEEPALDKITYNSGYYALEQFSQHIRKGYTLIYVSDENSVAALSADGTKLVVVAVNPEDTTVSKEVDLGLLDSFGALNLYRTSPTEQHINLPPPTVAVPNKVQLELPPQSVSTLEVSNVVVTSSGEDLISNGNFESVTETETGKILPNAWELVDHRDRDVDGVVEENSWRGRFSGLLELGPQHNSSLSQSFTSPSSCSFYLSAWASSTQGETKLGVVVNGGEAKEVEIGRNGVFHSYGLTFSAGRQETIQVYFKNEGSTLGGTAKIDDVVVHAKCS